MKKYYESPRADIEEFAISKVFTDSYGGIGGGNEGTTEDDEF